MKLIALLFVIAITVCGCDVSDKAPNDGIDHTANQITLDD